MRWLHPEHDSNRELSLEDVFIVPQRFDGVSRLEVDLTPKDFAGGSHPVVSANMNAVTGKRMAETMARYGGLGVLPQDMNLDTVRRIVGHIKQAEVRFDTALEVDPQATVRDVLGIIRKRSHDMVVIVDQQRRPLGVVTRHDLREHDQYAAVERLMRRNPVTLEVNADNRQAFLRMHEQRVRALPVVNAEGVLRGVITKDDTVRLELLSPSLDTKGRLMVASAVGISNRSADIAAELVEMGVDAIVLDTAHGHQRRMVESIQAVRHAVGGDVPIVAGNVCTAEGTRELLEAGADIAKVNVGPGAMCTTRMRTGVGRPTFSSVKECSEAARSLGKHVWADGGVRHARDVCLYMAAGAARVMVGTALAGTYESPGDIKEDKDGRVYKENYGMASARAVHHRTAQLDPFDRAKKAFFREGISSSRIYMNEGRESVGSILVEYITGLQSAFTYAGANTWDAFQERTVVGVQTASGYHEGTPHGRVRG